MGYGHESRLRADPACVAALLRRSRQRYSAQARTRVTLLFRLGWIFSFSLRLSQGVPNIFSLEGCLQTIRLFASLHILLRPYPSPFPSPLRGEGKGEGLFDQPDSRDNQRSPDDPMKGDPLFENQNTQKGGDQRVAGCDRDDFGGCLHFQGAVIGPHA